MANSGSSVAIAFICLASVLFTSGFVDPRNYGILDAGGFGNAGGYGDFGKQASPGYSGLGIGGGIGGGFGLGIITGRKRGNENIVKNGADIKQDVFQITGIKENLTDEPDRLNLTLKEKVEMFVESFNHKGNIVEGSVLDKDDNITEATRVFVQDVTQAPFPEDLLEVKFQLVRRRKFFTIDVTKESLDEAGFDSSLPTVFLFPGSHPTVSFDALIYKRNYLQSNNIVVNFGNFTQDSYFSSTVKTILVGLRTAKFVKGVMSVTGVIAENITLIGYDVGAQAAGYVGKAIPNIGRITALDAAGPIFQFLPRLARLTYTDALFVYALHTNGALDPEDGLGFVRPFADEDYFPNGGSIQPPCSNLTAFTKSHKTSYLERDVNREEENCNHVISIAYYLLGTFQRCYIATPQCNNYQEYESGNCTHLAAPLPTIPSESKFFYSHTKIVIYFC